ncbi:MAG TPA: thiamine-phosphate kinase [Acidimicrobiales bacterium]|nr:thiamine-phosphate kinase [Acidimicrobiales bacterium]
MTAGESAGGEFATIDRFRRRLPGPPTGEIWIGDDAAVLSLAAGPVLLTTDITVAGVHADLALMGLDDLGWRAVATAVSDVAAMGGRAGRLLVAVAGPASTDLDLLYRGVADAAAAHGCGVAGGDLSNASDLVVVVTVAGAVGDGPGPVLRSGARPGDHLFVTGPLGASAAGLRTLRAGQTVPALADAYRRPRARLVEGEAARKAGATAMIDVSDGLGADLGHIARASGVGFRLHDVPVAAGATIEEALAGGDDYQLVIAAPDRVALSSAFATTGLAPPLLIGVCTSDTAQREWTGGPLPATGFEHRWD